MDPVTHTLVGAALAEAGLKRRTALGTATLLIGANLPDVDVLAYAADPVTALWFRRGVTHGVVGLVVLPLLLTGAMLLWDRWRRRRPGSVPASGRALLLLAAIAVFTHPLLDSLNTYGMRWLMPFSGTWFYGDTLFIADPWVWGVLAVGVWPGRKHENRRNGEWRMVRDGAAGRSAGRPARLALAIVSLYVLLMAGSNLVARRIVARAAAAAGLGVPDRLMVAPVAANPFRRWVVVERDDGYRFARFDWLGGPAVRFDDLTAYGREPPHGAAAAATRGPAVRRFLSWARFPYFVVDTGRSAYVVHIGDARYTLEPEGSWAAMTVTVSR